MEAVLKYDETTIKILNALHKNPQASQREIAKNVEASVGKVNYIIKALAEKGIIKTSRFLNSKNKWAYRYILTPEGLQAKAQITKEFVKRKMEEYERLLKND